MQLPEHCLYALMSAFLCFIKKAGLISGGLVLFLREIVGTVGGFVLLVAFLMASEISSALGVPSSLGG